MSYNDAHSHDGHSHDGHSHHESPSWISRWLFSTNHKDIGTLYIIYSIFAGLVGGAASVAIRMQLAHPGGTVFHGDWQAYNTFVTGHAIIMVFFTVMPASSAASATGSSP